MLSTKKINAILEANKAEWLETLGNLPSNASADDISAARLAFALARSGEGEKGKVPGKRENRAATFVAFGRVNGALAFIGKVTCAAANSAESRSVAHDTLTLAALKAGAEQGTVKIALLATHDGTFVTV